MIPLLKQTNIIFLATAFSVLIAIISLLALTIFFMIINSCLIENCDDISSIINLESWKDISLMYLKAIIALYPFCFLHVWNKNRLKKDTINHEK